MFVGQTDWLESAIKGRLFQHLLIQTQPYWGGADLHNAMQATAYVGLLYVGFLFFNKTIYFVK